MTTTNQQYRDLYKKLSETKRAVIASPELDKVIADIALDYGLKDDKKSKLTSVIKDLLYEIYTISEVSSKIKEVLMIDETLSQQIGKSINDKILRNINNIYDLVNKNVNEENKKNGIIEDEEEDGQFELKDKTIIQRIQEISNKYNLNPIQTNILTKYTAEMMEKGTVISSGAIIGKLNVSSLMAEQIMIDLENRVFDLIKKQKENKSGVSQQNTSSPSQQTSNNTQIPEIKPDNLPMVEKQNSSFTPKPRAQTPVYTPTPKVVIENEVVQKPFSAPTFKAVPMSDIESGQDFMPKIEPKPSASGIMEEKLNSITKGITENKPQTPSQKSYSADPYREPLN